MKNRVVVAMSGGVDSSVAALRLHREGYEVIGVTLHLWDYPEGREPGRCCAPEDQYDARRVADHVGFAHYTFDRRSLFAEKVVAPFVDDYLSGRTPSPCVSCNRTVKLRELFPIATRLGANLVATGHYARVLRGPSGSSLHRGVDGRKDQSYFLHMMTQPELDRLVFPLGQSTKEEVRREAVEADLPGATKGESQELCFVADGRYAEFVEERAGGRVRPGPIVDDAGMVVGAHAGIHRFTVGQRKGLGLSLGAPAFVTQVDEASGAVQIGAEADLHATTAWIEGATFFCEGVSPPFDATVQVRARHTGTSGTVTRDASTGLIRATFHEPVRAISPGQMAVFYEGTRVLGGGMIVRPGEGPEGA